MKKTQSDVVRKLAELGIADLQPHSSVIRLFSTSALPSVKFVHLRYTLSDLRCRYDNFSSHGGDAVTNGPSLVYNGLCRFKAVSN